MDLSRAISSLGIRGEIRGNFEVCLCLFGITNLHVVTSQSNILSRLEQHDFCFTVYFEFLDMLVGIFGLEPEQHRRRFHQVLVVDSRGVVHSSEIAKVQFLISLLFLRATTELFVKLIANELVSIDEFILNDQR